MIDDDVYAMIDDDVKMIMMFLRTDACTSYRN